MPTCQRAWNLKAKITNPFFGGFGYSILNHGMVPTLFFSPSQMLESSIDLYQMQMWISVFSWLTNSWDLSNTVTFDFLRTVSPDSPRRKLKRILALCALMTMISVGIGAAGISCTACVSWDGGESMGAPKISKDKWQIWHDQAIWMSGEVQQDWSPVSVPIYIHIHHILYTYLYMYTYPHPLQRGNKIQRSL